MDIQYKHVVIGNLETSDYVEGRNLLISYIAYAIYKFWIQSENQKINFTTDCIASFIKKDIFARTLYNRNKHFISLCDKVIKGLH